VSEALRLTREALACVQRLRRLLEPDPFESALRRLRETKPRETGNE
jgi:hypothetical protein